MRKFRLPKIQYLFILLCALLLSAFQPSQAQYYLVESKRETAASVYQNADYDYLSGVSTSADDLAPPESDGCVNGVMSTFFNIAGTCIILPLILLFLLRGLIGNGVRNASLQSRHAAALYLDAPQQPLRWHDPSRKSLAETVGK